MKARNNSATVAVEEKGKEERVLKTESFDPYPEIWAANALAPHARVEVSVSKSFDYGSLRVTARVSLECEQKTAVLDKAGVLAFEKAKEFAIDGFNILVMESKEPT
jgi:hypothetical protein